MRAKWKWLPLLFLTVLVSFVAGVYADDGIKSVEAFLRPDFRLELDGEAKEFGETPLLYEGRTYLPVRSFSELLGADVDWRQSDFTVIVQTPRPEVADQDAGNTNDPNNGGVSSGEDRGEYVPLGPVIEKDPIRFEKLQNYVMKIEDEEYDVLTNQYKGSMFFRLSDLNALEIDMNGLRIWEEEETSMRFVLGSDLATRLEIPPRFDKILDDPVITGVEDEDMRKVLLRAHGTAHYVRPVLGRPGYYEALVSWDDEFHLRIVELTRSSGYSNSKWQSRFRERIKLYDDDDEDDD